MPEISSMKLPSGSVYDIKDATAREMIAALNQFTYEIVTTLPTASADTMYIIYLKPAGTVGTGDNYEEYITLDKGASVSPRYVWEKMGTITPPDLSDYAKIEDLGDLAWKDTASGTVAVPKTYTFTGTSTTGTVSGTASAQTFTGTGKELKFTGSAGNISVSGTTTGSISLTKSAVTISPAASGTPTYTPAGSNASSSISGSANITATGNVTTATTENKTVTVS